MQDGKSITVMERLLVRKLGGNSKETLSACGVGLRDADLDGQADLTSGQPSRDRCGDKVDQAVGRPTEVVGSLLGSNVVTRQARRWAPRWTDRRGEPP